MTQRGNGRAQTFFSDDDYRLYRDLLAEHARAARVDIWAWVLMPNHVHLILVPDDVDGIRKALSQVHGRYASRVNARLNRTGHFWQGRFGCVAMDEEHLAAALRYVALNPVRAKLTRRAEDWQWSSTPVHMGLIETDELTARGPVAERYPDFAALIASGEDETRFERLRKAETTGRPIGDERFLTRLEKASGRTLKPGKRGPKAKQAEELSGVSP